MLAIITAAVLAAHPRLTLEERCQPMRHGTRGYCPSIRLDDTALLALEMSDGVVMERVSGDHRMPKLIKVERISPRLVWTQAAWRPYVPPPIPPKPAGSGADEILLTLTGAAGTLASLIRRG